MSGVKITAKIAPSLLSSDFARLAEEAKRMVDAGADWLHMDVMDGHFVPNITIGPPVIKCLRQHTTAYLDCHCMVSNPGQWVNDFKDAGASQITFHIEAVQSDDALASLIAQIKEAGMDVGVAIKPKTGVDEAMSRIEPFMDQIHMVLIMTVEPGFGGQKFMLDMMPKVKTVRDRYPNLNLQVDGGLSPVTIDAAAKAGANVIVAGSSVFSAPDPKQVISALRESVEKYLGGPTTVPEIKSQI